MDEFNLKQKVMKELDNIKKGLEVKQIRSLQIDKLGRIVDRLDQFSCECPECSKLMETIENVMLGYLKSRDKASIKSYYSDLNKIVAHLQGKHKLVTEGQNTAIFMCLGMVMGMSLGMASGNYSIGMSIGMCIGLAVGAGIDGDAKKKGKVI